MIIKTFDDGSELTGTGLAATVLLGTALAGIGAVCAVTYESYKTRRLVRKYEKTN